MSDESKTKGMLVVAVVATVVIATSSLGQGMPVPAERQAQVLKRALAYDKTIEGEPLIVFIVSTEQESDLLNDLVMAFTRVGVTPAVMDVSELEKPGSGISVMYATPMTDPAKLKQFCADNDVLSISGVPAWAEQGNVSMSLGLSQHENVQIIVNLNQLRAEGHEFSADFLRIAKVIR